MNQPPASEFPQTVDEAVEWLESVLSDEQLHEIATTAENDLIDFHFGLGGYIRNALGLWKDPDNPISVDSGEWEPDEVSGIIIERLWRKLQDEREDAES
jgi:hypothetical protein